MKWTLRTICFFLIVLLPLTAAAQFTQVSATVTDPNGLAYANGTIVAKLVLPGGTSPTLNGLPYTPPSQPVGFNSVGFFLMQLADNNVLLPAATQWSFTVCSAGGTVQPAGGRGPVCFNAGPITITGASQSITATLNAAAVALSFASGGTINPNNGSAGAVAIYPAAGGSTAVSPTGVLTVSGGNTTFTGQLLGPAGSLANPTYASSSNPTSGLSFSGTQPLVSSNGTEVWQANGSTMFMNLPICDLAVNTSCLTFSNAGGLVRVTGSASTNFGFGIGKGQHFVNQAANSDADSQCTLVAGSCTFTFTVAYTVAPVCTATTTTTGTFTTGATLKIATATTSYTVTSTTGTDTATINVHCSGNPN